MKSRGDYELIVARDQGGDALPKDSPLLAAVEFVEL